MNNNVNSCKYIKTKGRHETKAMEFMLNIQRKLTNSRSQDLTLRISRKQLK
jgi:hypothetical protein